jgi:hypothetical protein
MCRNEWLVIASLIDAFKDQTEKSILALPEK